MIKLLTDRVNSITVVAMGEASQAALTKDISYQRRVCDLAGAKAGIGGDHSLGCCRAF